MQQTATASNAVPSENLTPSRSVQVHSVPSAFGCQAVAVGFGQDLAAEVIRTSSRIPEFRRDPFPQPRRRLQGPFRSAEGTAPHLSCRLPRDDARSGPVRRPEPARSRTGRAAPHTPRARRPRAACAERPRRPS
ncbi:hypothetical protein ACIRBZ_42135 [Streptomyces sp. NPDC094038]|uniref:hypothetical protein n=1 Tax=Streptomyces sp. NPDC094038 TaxID=3366055 RepID=UPI003816C18C